MINEEINNFLENKNLSLNSKKNYRSTYRTFFSKYSLNEISENSLTEVKDKIISCFGSNPKTLNENGIRLRMFLSYLKDKKLIDFIFKLDQLNFNFIKTGFIEILEENEIEIILSLMNLQEKITFLIYLYLGIRKEEILQLKFDDFKKDTKELIQTKNDKQRIIILKNDEIKALIFLAKESGINDFLSPSNFYRTLKRIEKKTNIELTFNKLRHTFATLYINYGGNVSRLTKLMGNSLQVVLDNYFNNNTLNAIKEYENIFNNKIYLKEETAYIKYLEEKNIALELELKKIKGI